MEAIVLQVQETSILSHGLIDLVLELVVKAHLVHGQDDHNCELELVGVNWIETIFDHCLKEEEARLMLMM